MFNQAKPFASPDYFIFISDTRFAYSLGSESKYSMGDILKYF